MSRLAASCEVTFDDAALQMLWQQRPGNIGEGVAARPVAMDEAAHLPGKQRGEADQERLKVASKAVRKARSRRRMRPPSLAAAAFKVLADGGEAVTSTGVPARAGTTAQ